MKLSDYATTDEMVGQTVKSVSFGHPVLTGHDAMPRRNSYGVLTLTMESGKVVVLSCSMLYSEISVRTQEE